MRGKHSEAPSHPAPKAAGPSRMVPILLGMLLVILAGVAGTALLMPEVIVDLVPPPVDVSTLGPAAAGLAAVTALLLLLNVVRSRRRTAEREFSRPQLATASGLTPEEEAEARRNDETAPLLPEPPSLAPPAEAPGSPAEVPEASPVATQTAPPPPARPRGSGVHIFGTNGPVGGNGHEPETAAAPSPPPAQAPDRPRAPFGWQPRHAADGGLLVAEAWSFGPATKGRRGR